MSKLANKWIDIFRVGNYGEKGNFTEADVDRVVQNYDPAAHEAPATIGHPKDDLPAYGWVSALRRTGDLLQAQFSQVDPDFESMVAAGKFNKRSASLYKHPQTGQVVGLRHVAFLGAQPPEVKGLRPIQFHDDGRGSAEVDFQEDSMAAEDSLIARLNAWLDEKFPKNAASTATFSEADVKRIATETATAAVTAAVAPLQAKLDTHAATFSEAQTTAATAAASAATRARSVESVNKLKAAGKWVPAFEKMGLSVVFDELAKTTTTVEFGEGEAKKNLTPLETFVSFMEQLGTIVPSAPVYTGQPNVAVAKGMKGVNAAPGKVDGNSVKFAEAISNFMEANKVDYTTAMYKVAEAHPELTMPGGAAVGAV